MDRRKFVSGLGLGAGVAGAALASPAIAQNKQRVKMVTTWPKGFPGVGTGAQRVADRITAMSDGRIEVKLFAAGELVPAFESFGAVAAGTAEMYHGADYYWQGKHKAYNFFTAVPLGFTAQELNAWVHYGGGQELWDELGKSFGVKGFLAGNTGVQMGGWFRNVITSLDDMKGLKMRMPGLGGEVLRRLGASAVALPGGEIFPALQAGTIDATEWIGPWNDRAFGFHKELKNYMYPGFHEPGSGLAVGINMGWWDSLSKADQALIESACHTENDLMLSEYLAHNNEALQDLITNQGVKLASFPEEVWLELAKLSDEVVREVGSEDDIGRRVTDSYFSFRDTAAQVTAITEASFTGFRAKHLGV